MRSMAPSTFTASSLAILLTLLLSTSSMVTARPCKTLFISSHSLAFRRLANPKNADLSYVSGSSSRFFTILTTTTTFTTASSRQFNGKPVFFLDDRRDFSARYVRVGIQQNRDQEPHTFEISSSLRDRSKDILSVVMALLFGVGCGALTAGTMYMVWSLLPSNRAALLPESDDEYDYDGESPKKIGYVKIPAPESSPIPSKA